LIVWRHTRSAVAASAQFGFLARRVSDRGLASKLTTGQEGTLRCYRNLLERDNPVRLAMVPQSLVRLETDFVREDDDRIDALRITVENATRSAHWRHQARSC
jgi:hypothetical protein